MPKKRSAGILLYRYRNNLPEVLLVHPGGPFRAGKDLGVWSIPKGEFEADENSLDAAKRELEEETGLKISGEFIELTPVKLKSGKVIYAWALQGDFNTTEIRSNEFEIVWPPKSGQKKVFPENDKAAWFTIGEAATKIIKEQVSFLTGLENILDSHQGRIR